MLACVAAQLNIQCNATKSFGATAVAMVDSCGKAKYMHVL